MKKLVLAVFATLFVISCGGGGSETVKSSEDTAERPVNPKLSTWIEYSVPYDTKAPIATNIKQECSLPEQLSQFIKLAADQVDVPVYRAEKGATKNKDRLIMKITDAVSSGNAFIGHRKYAKAEGTLYKNGKKVASFTSGRISGGGMWGGFKNSCSVLGRIMKVMGQDIANWMQNPVDGARLGDVFN